MSGGHFDYYDNYLYDIADKIDEDIEIKELVKDLANLLREYDYYVSADICKEDYIAEKRRFTDKWLNRKRSENLKEIINAQLEEFKEKIEDIL